MALLAVTTQLPGKLDSDLQTQAKITLFDYNVLAMLSEEEERYLPMSELASKTNASLSRLSHVVKKLEARGWVERTQCPSDARVTMAHLSDAGCEMLEGLAAEHVESVRRLIFDGLDSKDVDDLSRLGRKITARLDPDHWIFRDEA
ncbi:MarR family winged helix-turn-helix transcriptional regulator [Paeniglutamicibacter cryotolerans]